MAKAQWWLDNQARGAGANLNKNKMMQPGQTMNTNSGQFGNTAYNNPQMNQVSGNMASGFQAPQGDGWYNPRAANTQWQMGMAPNEAAWQGSAPGHQGQGYSYNPMTGQGAWQNTSGGTSFGGNNPYGSGALTFTDPITGLKVINPNAIKNMTSFMTQLQGGSNQFQPSQYEMTEYSGPQVTAPGAYGGFDYSTIGSGIDPSAVIAAQEYRLQEAMEGDMARAGSRAGQSGFAMSTPYANQLGEAARKAAQDRNAITLQYQYDAAQQQAQRDLAQQLQAGQHDFGGWQTQGGWDMNAQLANQNQAIQQWMLQNQMGMQNTDMQNQYGLDQQGMQQQMLASILGGLF